MSLHPLATEFARLAEVYERGRPGYPASVAERLTAELSLTAGARVLDLAAGTGKLTRALVAAGLDVAAVEPLEPLRAVLAGVVGAHRIRDGLAERIPFADGTFAAVTVADAFHWFDQEPALAEMRRVLRPGGGLALVSAQPAWSDQMAAILEGARTGHPYFDGAPWQETLSAARGWAVPREVRVVTRQRLQVRDYVASMSWVSALDPEQREVLLSDVAEISRPEVEIDVHTIMCLSARD